MRLQNSEIKHYAVQYWWRRISTFVLTHQCNSTRVNIQRLSILNEIFCDDLTVKEWRWERKLWSKSVAEKSINLINTYHYTVSLLDFCRMYGVHKRLLSTCVGYFAYPGIDTQVQGTTVFSLIWQTLCIHKYFVCVLAGIEPKHEHF
jgi:hypothetical protein